MYRPWWTSIVCYNGGQTTTKSQINNFIIIIRTRNMENKIKVLNKNKTSSTLTMTYTRGILFKCKVFNVTLIYNTTDH